MAFPDDIKALLILHDCRLCIYSISGNIEDALPHFINFIHFSGNPNATLMTLQQSMPAPLFNLIYQAYMAMRVQGLKSAAGGGSGGGKKATAKKDEAEVD